VVEIRASAQTLIEVSPKGIFREVTQGHPNQAYANVSSSSFPGKEKLKGSSDWEASTGAGFHTFLRTKWVSGEFGVGRAETVLEEQEVTLFVRECPCKYDS